MTSCNSILAMKPKTSPSSHDERQEADGRLPTSHNIVETRSQQKRHHTGVTGEIHENNGDDIYAECRLDYGSSQIRILTLFPSSEDGAPLEGSLRIVYADITEISGNGHEHLPDWEHSK